MQGEREELYIDHNPPLTTSMESRGLARTELALLISLLSKIVSELH